MINIREIRIGDIITKENKYEGYKYSIVEGIDNIRSAVRFVIERCMKMEAGRWQYLHTKICRRIRYQ